MSSVRKMSRIIRPA
ncbi:hypothetical protein [Caulobacter vibrioides]|uniref:Uncharacterized protein n=1 Tax=Caulobacter vibrioides (strain NA1000 / CB15N) TaxID=565050 RepID=A0A0H3J429_CAUVN|nr:hypothetical protein [Caulobacter vibrioides]YP_009020506.1 hypothetical protein CCNA_03934 [Caulobacter vibrioides NA1000]AHI88537.1 hypothetical protein CCNA_03934 [Caulobacter vibrioides NA1000]QXZ53925.1 hypothetical protein KZH45_03645 [Caulobacter vibrioides]